jgi:RNA polymerase sigma factor (sigma-70 family)
MNPNTRSETGIAAVAVSQADLKTLEMRISRYRRLLYFLAYRVLGNHTDAEQAVQSCILAVPRNVPSLEHEGGFRAWLVRALINEALAILRKNRLETLMLSFPSRVARIKLQPSHFASPDGWHIRTSDSSSSFGD